MNITITLNGKKISEEIDADLLLIDFVRNHGCYSVKRGCEMKSRCFPAPFLRRGQTEEV